MSQTESIGKVLRLERERRGMSLDEVSESTKITVHNLAALEEDRFEFFPNRVYARAFLRDYANFLGLESASLLERYENERVVSQETPEAPVVRRRPWRTVGIAAVVGLVIAGLGGVAYVGWRLHDEYMQVADSRPKSAVRTRQQRPRTKPTAAEKPTRVEPQPPSDRITLKFTAVGNVWVDARTDGRTVIYVTVPKGTTRTFEAKNKIYIRVGKANAARLELNGEPVTLPPKSVPVTRVFTRPAIGPPPR